MDLAGAYRIVEESQGLVDRRVGIMGVDLVEVDRLAFQATERVLERAREVPARQPEVVRPDSHGEPPLRGEHDLAPEIGRPRDKPTPDDLF